MSDRYEAQEVEARYWRVHDHALGYSIAGYTGENAYGDAAHHAAMLNLNPWRWEQPETTEELPEAEQTQPDPDLVPMPIPPPYYYRVDPIGGHFEAVCSNCETTVIVIEHRMSVATPVAACAGHTCPIPQGDQHG